MDSWEWQETYLVNISNLDVHHRKLVTLFNSLYNDVYQCQKLSQKQPLIEKALTELIDYCIYHFEAEEKLMLQYQYPGYAPHKEEHERFKLQVTQMMQEHKDGNLTLSFPILHFIKKWFNGHILTTDKQYGPYLNEKM